ncbi:PucR family transcriptional regulator [Marinisporobacter balticus]|uniref:PucR-like helix-turn-helix protein n=1 Tax=Marinisporobacter balticus TaxID=2018667 RepID=A0A4R2L0U7_9FIRM|nr:PucR family transcriptional regulator [Marinisporobacter balticus]TCO77419.1 PucR-like helix-turn-helix protein [Marinisporobacter balticus]
MALTVHEALKLDALKRFRLVAGMNGLDRKITRAGILDHEVAEQVGDIVQSGEFIFSNLLAIRDQPEKIIDFVKHLIDAQAACFAIKTIYFKEIPKEAIELAHKHRLPLFLFDETYVETLILEIDKAINIQNHEQHIKLMIDQISGSNLNEFRIRDLAYEINRNFKKNHIVYFARETENHGGNNTGLFNPNNLSNFLGDSGLVISYRNGYLVIATYDNEKKEYIKKVSESALKASGLLEGKYRLGMSEIKNDLGALGRAIDESKYAYDFASLYNMKQATFLNMGIYQLLIPIINDPWAYAFYRRKIDKLISYDQNKGTDLLNTAIAYVESGGNIQNTSKKLFQHTNTIRYRIRKINEIVDNTQLKSMTYETLAIAIRLHLIHSKLI